MVGVTICGVEFSYFGLCNVLCMEGLQSIAWKVCSLVQSTWGTSVGEDQLGARVGYLMQK